MLFNNNKVKIFKNSFGWTSFKLFNFFRQLYNFFLIIKTIINKTRKILSQHLAKIIPNMMF